MTFLPGRRISLILTLDRVSNYEVEPKWYKGHEIPGHVVWRYQFHDESGQRFVYSGKYIFGIIADKPGVQYSFRATVKRHEPNFSQIRLSRMSLQKEVENLFAF